MNTWSRNTGIIAMGGIKKAKMNGKYDAFRKYEQVLSSCLQNHTGLFILSSGGGFAYHIA